MGPLVTSELISLFKVAYLSRFLFCACCVRYTKNMKNDRPLTLAKLPVASHCSTTWLATKDWLLKVDMSFKLPFFYLSHLVIWFLIRIWLMNNYVICFENCNKTWFIYMETILNEVGSVDNLNWNTSTSICTSLSLENKFNQLRNLQSLPFENQQ